MLQDMATFIQTNAPNAIAFALTFGALRLLDSKGKLLQLTEKSFTLYYFMFFIIQYNNRFFPHEAANDK